ncbi:unnamed protein product [Cyclocybe aegerita]|uniref:Uncharacterized protein n=1 Tax=Cyclocybe aegerita TaxID=1973307 RepID=A0A8S0X086_CYCAE|nr:unnamed protein product [Cyclocybe aegerita]
MSYVASSRSPSRAWETPTYVVPIADWSKAPANAGIYSHYEAPSPVRTLHRSKTTSSRKPLRSSPLAGPALSNHSEAFIELDDTPNDDTHLSTSELSSKAVRGRNVHDGDHDGESFPAPAPPQSAHLRARSSQGLARTSSAESMGYPSSSSTPRAHTPTLRYYHSYHVSTLTSAMHNVAGDRSAKRRRPFLDTPTDSMANNLKRPPSAIHPPTEKAHTHGPERVARNSSVAKMSKDITGLGSARDARGARYSFASCSSSSSLSSNFSASTRRRRVSTVLEVDGEDHDLDSPANLSPGVGTSANARAHPSAKSDRPVPTDNSWYTANAYDVTPKFTRLGLAGPGVVLPVSARAHRKQQQCNPAASNVDKEKEKRASIANFQLTRRSSTVSTSASTSTSTSAGDGIGSAWLEAPSPSTHSSSSSPSPTPTCSSPASSVSSLPLTTMTPKSAASSQATSLISSWCTSIEVTESEETSETAKSNNSSRPHQDSRTSALKKRQSVSLLSRMASWHRSTPTVDAFEWREQKEADWAVIEKVKPLHPVDPELEAEHPTRAAVAVTVSVHLEPAPSDDCSTSAESETDSRESATNGGGPGRYEDAQVARFTKSVNGAVTVKRCGSVRRFWKALVGAGAGSLSHHPSVHGEVMRA